VLFTKIFDDAQFPTGGVTPPPMSPPPPVVELPPQKTCILFVMLQPPEPVPFPLLPLPGNPPVELFKIPRISLTVEFVETEVL
jgi:hypothetical protein